jgi:hypothetical protein
MRLSSQTLWPVVASVAFLGAVPSIAFVPSKPSVGVTAVMQIDLLFPRDDQVYAPTPYMPIVFAVQNPSLARHTYPSMLVHLQNSSTVGQGTTYTQALNVTNWSSNETFFAYTLVDTFAHEGNWTVDWHLAWYSCKIEERDKAFLGLMERNCTCERPSGVGFITKNGGQAIDLVASTAAAAANETACATEPGDGFAINVDDKAMQIDNLFRPDWLPLSEDKCIIASETTPSARNACRVKIDSALAANITADVRAKVCAGANPPSDCPSKSAAQRSATVGVGCGLTAAFGALGLLLA